MTTTTTAGQAAAAAAAVASPQQEQNIQSSSSASGGAIQTASLNESSMMTYMPPEANNNNNNTSSTNQNSKQETGDCFEDYSMLDEQQFNSSLDAFLDMEQAATTTMTPSQQQEAQSAAAPVPSPVPAVAVGGDSQSTDTTKRNCALSNASMLTQRLAYPGMMMPSTQQQHANRTAMPAASPQTMAPYGTITSGASVRTISTAGSSSNKRPRPTTATTATRGAATNNRDWIVSENEDERKRRKRHDRNMREQQRSHRVTQQIGHLREILEGAHVQFKPDKHSTLVSVVDYIKQLQQRSAMLDAQHETLLDTISKTGRLVMDQQARVVPITQLSSSSSSASEGFQEPAQEQSSLSQEQCLQDNMMVFVRGLDYKRVFTMCGIALAVASIDGRFMDCNVEFEHLSGYTRDELLPNRSMPPQPQPSSTDSAAETRQITDTAALSPCSATTPDLATTASSTTTCPWPPQRNNLSLFNLFSRQDMEKLFVAMSEMLKRPFSETTGVADGNSLRNPRLDHDYWSGSVRRNRKTHNVALQMNITLVRSPHGRPKFFCCALNPSAASVGPMGAVSRDVASMMEPEEPELEEHEPEEPEVMAPPLLPANVDSGSTTIRDVDMGAPSIG